MWKPLCLRVPRSENDVWVGRACTRSRSRTLYAELSRGHVYVCVLYGETWSYVSSRRALPTIRPRRFLPVDSSRLLKQLQRSFLAFLFPNFGALPLVLSRCCACPYLVSIFLSLFLSLSLSLSLSFSRSISRSSVFFPLCVSLSPTPFRSAATFRPELL